MQGLQGVVRLARHHAGTLLTSVHPVCVAVTKHIRSLRSQVSRAACQAAAELFASLGRAMEPVFMFCSVCVCVCVHTRTCLLYTSRCV